MKNEIARNKKRRALNTSPVERNCMECDNCKIVDVKDGGLSSVLLPDGKWSEPTTCHKYNIRCKLDGEIKGYVFSAYEELIPYKDLIFKAVKDHEIIKITSKEEESEFKDLL